jgi:hypothetical protein
MAIAEEKPNALFSPKASDYQLASAVAPHVALNNVFMTKISAELKMPWSDAIACLASREAGAKISWKSDYELPENSTELHVNIAFTAVLGNQAKDAKPVIELLVSYVLDYTLDSPPPSDLREGLMSAFARVNGVYVAWPYIREAIQTTCAKMNLPPPLLPVYRVPRPTKAVSTQGGEKEKADRAAE